MGALKPWHIVVLVVLVLLLFGAGKLPSLARNMGKSMRIFKSEVEELRGDDHDDDEDDDEPRRRDSRRDQTARDRDRREGGSDRGDDRGDRRDTSRDADRGREYDPRDEREREPQPHRDDDYRRD